MKSLLSLLARYALTLSAVAAATLLAFMMWKHYAQTPWTRDGRVRADVVQIAPDVSGPVISVAVRDNQWVNRGDVLYAIDPRWLRLAVASAQADVESKRHEMLMRQDAAHRRTLIKNAISSEDVQQTGSAANVAAANYHGALAALDLAELNLAHATGVRRFAVRCTCGFSTVAWRKLLQNAVAGLMVLANRRAGMFRREDISELALAYLREGLTVARAEGAKLADDVAQEILANFQRAPEDLGTSILADRQADRPMEWDIRNGVIQRYGRKHGIAVPISDVVVPLLAAGSEGPG
jgi:multidrug efflux pump subunit AcrA (membrane-fusion protein)